MEVKPFARQGNYTQFDNAVIDVIMPSITPVEWVVLSFIIRKTVGWQKEVDGIAYSQFIAGTGIGSNTTIQKALLKLNQLGIIEVLESAHKSDPHHYRLNKNYSCRITDTVTRPITLAVIRPVTDTVNTKEKEINIKTTPEEKTPIDELMDYFIEITHCREPNGDMAEKWAKPLVAIYKASGENYSRTKSTIKAAVEVMREKDLTIANPGSIQNVAVSLKQTQRFEVMAR